MHGQPVAQHPRGEITGVSDEGGGQLEIVHVENAIG